MTTVFEDLNVTRLALNAEEIKALTGWPDAMVEDYLNILNSLIDLAQNIDINIDNLDNLTEAFGGLEVRIGKLYGSVNQNSKDIDKAKAMIVDLAMGVSKLRGLIIKNQKDIQSVKQLAVSWA